jgi:polar amino acid transport system substrate-binding protein
MELRSPRNVWALALIGTVAAVSLTACASSATPAATETTAATPGAESIPLPELDQDLHDSLPESVLDSGTLTLATIQLPPYAYKGEDGTTYQGLNVDTAAALEAILGVKVDLEIAPGVADIFTGFDSDKYDASIAPLSDIPATQEKYDFADWLSEFVVFVQPAAEAESDTIDSLEAACGHSIATLQGGTAQKVLEAAQADCGDKPITIDLYGDQDKAILAVKSGRADAAFSSQIPLTYYVEQDDTLALSGANSTDNGFPPFWVGAFAPKGDPIVETLLGAFDGLKEAGTYDALLEKYGITANSLDEFGLNLSAQ